MNAISQWRKTCTSQDDLSHALQALDIAKAPTPQQVAQQPIVVHTLDNYPGQQQSEEVSQAASEEDESAAALATSASCVLKHNF